MKNEQVLVLNFGGQYSELIARCVRECNVNSVIKPGNITPDEVKKIAPIGIILTGGPDSIYEEVAQACVPELFEINIPILGICYGMHVMTHMLGGEVTHSERGEYGVVNIKIAEGVALFKGIGSEIQGLMSHKDKVSQLPAGFEAIASTDVCVIAAAMDTSRKLFGLQFHPEVESTERGREIIHNFLYDICNATGDYSISDYEERMIGEIKEQVGNRRVLLGLSGGVDSTVCAALLSKTIPDKLDCVFVDHGMMRKDEGDEVEAVFKDWALNLIRVDATERFLDKLKGVTDPEQKRKIIGEEFVRVFEEEAGELKGTEFLAQGTIYPDVVESGATGSSATIKSHHNVGGLPEEMEFRGLVEPLRGLFKSEVRQLGRSLGLPRSITERQPFPGPGLAVRCIGEITKEKLDILREVDAIFRVAIDDYFDNHEAIGETSDMDKKEQDTRKSRPDQYFAVLMDTRSVGVTGDFRTYGYTVALRAVKTNDFMTCEYAPLPHALLDNTAKQIVDCCPAVSRVVYDITGKPPATIEWE